MSKSFLTPTLLFSGLAVLVATDTARTETSLTQGEPKNVIANSDFQDGQVGYLPDGWHGAAARPVLRPVFRLEQNDGRKLLMATGGGNGECTGYLHQSVPVKLGETYLYRVVFRMSAIWIHTRICSSVACVRE